MYFLLSVVDTWWLTIHKALKVPLAKVPSSFFVHSSLYVNKSVIFLTPIECLPFFTVVLSLTSTGLSGSQCVIMVHRVSDCHTIPSYLSRQCRLCRFVD